MAGKKNVLSSLAVYAEDSEPESDGEAGVEAVGSAAEEKGGLVSDAYGEDDFSRLGGDEDGYEEEEDENSKQSEDDDSETEKPEADDPKDNAEVEKRDPQELVASFSERVRNMSPDEIKIPPEPPGRCSNHLQDKIQKLYERKIKEGMDMNYIIQRKKEFRNPSIYEKLIQFCAIDELGTNYPKDMFDPHGWSEDSYYEALAKAQKIEMDKLEKAKKERTKSSLLGHRCPPWPERREMFLVRVLGLSSNLLVAGTCLQRLGTGAVLPLCGRAPPPPGCEEEGPGQTVLGM
ncbi:SAP30-binding protein isoform X3 [Microcebus murinus]|uniref:SAP30-binding protein isoform X3 n=1 Tax=Microcebus murinus TaxID=30608 RepID=UPI000643D009|nr:SAP30-binding protein isoform X3 [Microcebus murinus]